ncbi:Hint domain-containing protein [Yoonia sp. F2084L]|uniref:Hint domain-containing protein n=1 Tax=Yoonia sp. F2084L TaxID=2926419 RepID=UPI001FF34F80|nr:Hint domain-containing protein [Yoonia sp. F2084L]MCK0095365.1 Hint domain-containing protein [Yoonia sp. F2084L]
MAQYSYIGYDTTAVVFSGGNVSLSGTYDANVNRRVFDVNDGAGGTVLGGRTDAGVIFDGDRLDDEDGDDATQTGVATNLDGTTTFASGDMYLEESYLLTAPGGATITMYRVEVEGVFVGHIVSEPLDPGVTYTFSITNVTPFNAPDTTDPTAIVDVPCFFAGTMIMTPDGERAVDDLNVGDHVTTASGETQIIRWIGRRVILPSFATDHGLWPVRISTGALSAGLPTCDLTVSPNHRMLISSPENELHFGQPDVLVAAKFLIGQDGVEQVTDLASITYFHLLFDKHEILVSNGVPSESLYPGDMTLRGMARAAQDEIMTLFPELQTQGLDSYGPVATRTLRRHEAALLAPAG